MRVIVDTNIIVSGLLSPTGPPGKIVDAVLQGILVPVMSSATLAELEDKGSDLIVFLDVGLMKAEHQAGLHVGIRSDTLCT